ncbi:MAG: galactokinase [Clostridiales bacterium GWF2_36_10]|nr:MAG: galactokinase [Clostridiales bacterium GWF2_36_10]HAN22134.1 galactokinase [Clostridiales bacterium]
MIASGLLKEFNEKKYDRILNLLYGCEKVDAQRERYIGIIESFLSLYGDLEVNLFSVPGRSEISGNHTDHNNGKVLAAAVDIDIIAVSAKCSEKIIRIKSEGYREDVVEISELDPSKVRKGTSSAIIAGICEAFDKKGYNFGGFAACTTSDVLTGSGLSSSAAFEVMCGNILSHFYNDNKIPVIELAKAGKYSENIYFGKPCGLMDQAACAYGGFLYIDFKDSDMPIVEKLNFDLSGCGYSLCIVNTGGNHADLTEDYASVPKEMKTCANLFGKNVLREVDEEDFISRIGYLRGLAGDRAIMRAMHFFCENSRVENQREVLKKGNLTDFFRYVVESGNSSFKFLQNVYTNKNITEQGLSLALAVSERLGVVCRVHGGGYAGTIQAYIPTEKIDEYRKSLEDIFGKDSCMFLKVRPYGAIKFDKDNIY